MARANKLTSDQWQEVSDHIADGGTLRTAQDLIRERFGVEVSRAAISQNRHVRPGFRARRADRLADAHAVLEGSLAQVCRAVVKRLTRIDEAQDRIHEKLSDAEPGSSEFQKLSNNSAALDRVFKGYLEPYQAILEFAGLEDSPTSGESEQTPTESFLKSLRGKVTEATRAEVETSEGLEDVEVLN